MAYKVVATPFGRVQDPNYPLESEGLKPLGITIETADVSSTEAYLNSIRDADAVIAGGQWLNGEIINKLEKCKVIANGGVGVDRIDLDAATERGIVVTNVPDVFVEEVAVHAMMLILACAKKVVNLDKVVRENRWADGRNYLKPMPRVVGDTIGLIPFGNIPRLVAKKAKGFDMHVIAWDPFVDDAVFEAAGVERVTDIADIFKRSDWVSGHLPLNKHTEGMLNYDLFAQMKPTAYFINTGRGPTHNEADLIRALNEGKMAGAGLDVMEQEPTLPDNPLHQMENVVLTPHTASVSDIGNIRRRQRVGYEIAAVLQGQMPFAVVNRDVLNVVTLTESSQQTSPLPSA
jgi:D-3-phosphoglycerate dehydrogenase